MSEPELRLAQAALMAGDFEEALRQCNLLIDRAPQNPAAWQMRGEILGMMGRPEEAGTNQMLAEKIAAVPPEVVEQVGRNPVVRRLGPTFSAMGWALALINFGCFVFSLVTFARVLPEFSRDEAKYRSNQSDLMALFGKEFSSVITLSFLVWLLTILWLTLDLSDREGPWPWMIGGVLFGMLCVCAPYMGPGWLLIPLYMLLGRRKS